MIGGRHTGRAIHDQATLGRQVSAVHGMSASYHTFHGIASDLYSFSESKKP